jgi:hypothetical protein
MIIGPEYTRFIMGHFILDNIIIVWEGMDWARCLGLDALFMKIEFEKAYDRFEWLFMLGHAQGPRL